MLFASHEFAIYRLKKRTIVLDIYFAEEAKQNSQTVRVFQSRFLE